MKKNPTTVAVLLFCLFVQFETSFAQTATELVTHAKSSIEKKDYASALNDTTAAIKLDANNADAFFWRGYAYKLQKDYLNALADVNESIRLNPQKYLAFGLRGDIHYKQKAFDEAIADYTKAIELNPQYVTGYFNRGVANEAKGSSGWNAALADLTKAIELNPKDSDSFNMRGFVNMDLTNWKAAESDYLTALNLGDKSDNLFAVLSYIDIKLSAYTQAAMNALQALEFNPNNSFAKVNLEKARRLREKPFDAGLSEELTSAATANNYADVIRALNLGAQVNSTFTYSNIKLSSALQRAASLNNYMIVKALISVGADVNLADANDWTPLHYTATYDVNPDGRAAVAELLLKNGANVNSSDAKGNTPLHSACLWGNNRLVELFIKAGANVNARDQVGRTPLNFAIGSGTNQAVKMLINAKADVNAPDDINKFSPLALSLRQTAFAFTKMYLLLKAGASTDLPAENTKDFPDSMVFINRIKNLSPGSIETKLFDAAADGDASGFTSLLNSNANIDKSLLNYLLLMSVASDNASMLQALLAKGADPNFTLAETNAVKIAKIQHKNNAYNYLSNYSTAPVETDNTGKNEQKIAELMGNAASSLSASNNYFREAIDLKNAGRDKGIYCVRIRNASQETSYALKFINEAEGIFSLEWGAKIKDAKKEVTKQMASLSNLGCPITLEQ